MLSVCSLSLYQQEPFPAPCRPQPRGTRRKHPRSGLPRTGHSSLTRRSFCGSPAKQQRAPQLSAATPPRAAPHRPAPETPAKQLHGSRFGASELYLSPPAALQGTELDGVVRGVQPPRGQLSCRSSSPPELLGAASGPVTSALQSLRATSREPRGTAAPAPLCTVSQKARAGLDLGRAALPRTPGQNPSRAAAEPPPAAPPLGPQPSPAQPSPAQQHPTPTCTACGPGFLLRPRPPPAAPALRPQLIPISPPPRSAPPVRFSKALPGARALQEPLQAVCPRPAGWPCRCPGPSCRCVPEPAPPPAQGTEVPGGAAAGTTESA